MLAKLTPFLSIIFFLGLFSCDHNNIRNTEEARLFALQKKATKLNPLLKELENLRKDENFKDAEIGYMIMDITDGKHEVVAEYNQTDMFIPASTQKLLTTGAALEIFGDQISRQVFMTNQNSLNWLANKLLKKVGEEKYHKRDYSNGCKPLAEFWREKGLDTTGLKIIDAADFQRQFPLPKDPDRCSSLHDDLSLSLYFL